MAQQVSARRWSWIWVVVGIAVFLGLYVYVRAGRSVVDVRVVRAERHDIVSQVSTNGKVQPANDFQAYAPISGAVGKIFVTLNQKVRAGQELLAMDDSDARKGVASAQANLVSAKATLEAMQHGGTQDELLTSKADMDSATAQVQKDENFLASLQRLQTQGAASANEVNAAQQQLTDARARVAQLQARRTGRYASSDLAAQRAQVAQAEAALSSAQSVLAGIDQRSPIAGTVYAIPVSQYDFVQAGENLVDVADLTRLQVRAYFDEPEIGKLAIGQPVKIVWDAKPNEVWHGHILQAPTTIINYGTRNVGECLITVDDAHGDLLPNTNVTVTVTTSQKSDVLSLPREALHTLGSSNFVYRVVNNRLVKTPVGVGVLNLTRVEITSGLKGGDEVALEATNEADLNDGLRVKAQP